MLSSHSNNDIHSIALNTKSIFVFASDAAPLYKPPERDCTLLPTLFWRTSFLALILIERDAICACVPIVISLLPAVSFSVRPPA